jgi:predicted nucleic acid-binding protein
MSLIKVLFDTNVLTYAHDEFFDFHIPSASLVEMVFQGKIQGIVTEQNMMELYRLLTNQTVMRGKALQPAKAKELISDTYLNGAFDVLFSSQETLRSTLKIAVENNIVSAKIFDIRLAAIALEAEVNFLVTYNLKDFAGIANLTCATPETVLASLL